LIIRINDFSGQANGHLIIKPQYYFDIEALSLNEAPVSNQLLTKTGVSLTATLSLLAVAVLTADLIVGPLGSKVYNVAEALPTLSEYVAVAPLAVGIQSTQIVLVPLVYWSTIGLELNVFT